MTDWKQAYTVGAKRVGPLVFSAGFFGLIFGFTGASGGLKLGIISAMSILIFAGSAQFITLVLIIEKQTLVAVFIAATIINLRHLIYGGVLHDLLEFRGIKRLIPAYFLTDEAFLVTTLINKEKEQISLDWVLIGAGSVLWFFWNLTTITGYLIYQVTQDIISLPENFVLASSFVGFLVEHWVKHPQDRGVIAVATVLALGFGFIVESSALLIIVMAGGAIFALLRHGGAQDD